MKDRSALKEGRTKLSLAGPTPAARMRKRRRFGTYTLARDEWRCREARTCSEIHPSLRKYSQRDPPRSGVLPCTFRRDSPVSGDLERTVEAVLEGNNVDDLIARHLANNGVHLGAWSSALNRFDRSRGQIVESVTGGSAPRNGPMLFFGRSNRDDHVGIQYAAIRGNDQWFNPIGILKINSVNNAAKALLSFDLLEIRPTNLGTNRVLNRGGSAAN